MNTFANVTSSILNCGVSIHVGQQAKAEAICIGGRVGEAVDGDAGRLAVKRRPNATVKFIVGYL